MIALRRKIERGVRHPVFGPVFLVLLALLLVFTVMHGAHDQIHEGELMVCIAFLVAAVLLLILPRLNVVHVVARRASRAPPTRRVRLGARPRRLFGVAPIPLRL